MKDFYELTDRGQARRLRRMALAALENYDLDVRRVSLLTNDMNGIFRIDTTGGTKYILRVCFPEMHSFEGIRSEMMWLAALRQDTNLSVPQPRITRDGRLLTTVQVPGVPEARHCVVFGWVKGKDLAERPTPENWRGLGEFASRLHDHGAAFQPTEGFDICRYDKVYPFGDSFVVFDDAHRHLFPPGRRCIFQRVFDRVQAAIDRLNAGPDGMHVIHGDLHQWNVKVYRGRVSALDFEDLMWGYPVQDIAITFYYIQDHEQYAALRGAFVRGYTSRRPWPEAYPGEIDTFIAGRGLMLANDVLLFPNLLHPQETSRFVERTEARLRAFLEDCEENNDVSVRLFFSDISRLSISDVRSDIKKQKVR